MLVRPSFSAEYVITLHRDANRPKDAQPAGKTFLTYSVSDHSIWYSMPENNDQKEQKKISITTITVEFPKPLGLSIYELWRRMLQRTRYSDKSYAGLDGTIYEFSLEGRCGEFWSPQERKSPTLLIELGESLVSYCNAAVDDRLEREKDTQGKAARLSKYLDEHP